MIPVTYYATVYHVIISLIALILCFKLFLENNASLQNKSKNKIWCIVLLLITILFIGLRDPWAEFEYFGDTQVYSHFFMDYSNNTLYDGFKKDIGFHFFLKFCASFFNLSIFYLICAFIYVYPVYYTFKKWFGNLSIYALLIYVVTMSFWTFGINGVRTGLAVSLFIFALGFINVKWLMILFMLLSISIHKSLLLPISAFLITFFIKNIKWIIFIWFFSIAVCLFSGKEVMNFMGFYISGFFEDPRLTHEYTSVELFSQEVLDRIRFRWDFLIYSATPILLGWYYIIKKRYTDRFYIQLFNTYVLTNAVWIIFFMYAAFTNRFAYLSWCIMSIVMIYPLLKEKIMINQKKIVSLLILGNLLFTLILFFR